MQSIYLGAIAIQTGNPQRAVELFGKAIEIDPNNAAAYCNRGLALRKLKQLDVTLASYDRAVASKADYATGYYVRSFTHLLRGDLHNGCIDQEWRWKINSSYVREILSIHSRGALIRAALGIGFPVSCPSLLVASVLNQGPFPLALPSFIDTTSLSASPRRPAHPSLAAPRGDRRRACGRMCFPPADRDGPAAATCPSRLDLVNEL